jgi:hypothetical protein
MVIRRLASSAIQKLERPKHLSSTAVAIAVAFAAPRPSGKEVWRTKLGSINRGE